MYGSTIDVGTADVCTSPIRAVEFSHVGNELVEPIGQASFW